MTQDFNLDLEQSRMFVKYFMAAMKEPGNPILPGNSSERFENGYYLSEHSVSFEWKGEKIFINWLLKFNSDYTLNSISNLNNVGNTDFELRISGLLNEVLQNVLSLKRNKYFRRKIYHTFSGTNFMGEYWLQGSRFAQLIPEDHECHLVNAERLLVIDQKIEAIDDSNATEIANEKASELSSFLSFIMNIGLEVPNSEERFFLARDKDKFSMQRSSNQIISTDHAVSEMPKKKELSPLGEFKGSVFDRFPPMGSLVCPTETRKILAGISDSTEEIKDAFRRCCKLYQLALNVGRGYPTVRISYLCGAVEAIVKSNQEEYVSFSDFMTKYSGENRELHSFIYSSVRSAHFHSGSFVLGEFDFASHSMNPHASKISDDTMSAEAKMRFAIFNWLNEKIEFADKQEHNFKPFETKRFSVFGRTTIGKKEKN